MTIIEYCIAVVDAWKRAESGEPSPISRRVVSISIAGDLGGEPLYATEDRRFAVSRGRRAKGAGA